jgi:hypothetical protein
MTTFQDPTPQSRRSARQSERTEHDAAAQSQAQTGAYYPAQPTPPGAPPASSHAPASHTAPPHTAAPHAATQPAGRRASRAAAQGLYEVQPEPLGYMTQGQPTGDYSAAAQTHAPTADGAGYRIRDFSPESQSGRRAAPPLVEPQQPYDQQSAQAPSDLDYRTQQVQPGAQPTGGYAAGPASGPAPGGGARSRREMRESAQQQTYEVFATGQQPSFPHSVPLNPVLQNPTQQPYAGQQHPTQQPYPTHQPQQHSTQQSYPYPQHFTGQQPGPAPSQYPTGAQPTPPATQASSGRRAAPTPPPPPTNLTTAMAEFEALARANATPPQPGARAATAPAPVVTPAPAPGLVGAPHGARPATQTGGWSAPAGHWSRQADLDDETQPWESTITREVGGGHASTTTSTLILPDIPRPNNFPTALNSTGEVLLTGSIDLPRSLSAMGADSRSYDNADVDNMFDSNDREYSATDSSPVRAARAVSTHTSSRGVIHATAPHGNRMLTVLFVTALVLAVAVTGFVIYAITNNVF